MDTTEDDTEAPEGEGPEVVAVEEVEDATYDDDWWDEYGDSLNDETSQDTTYEEEDTATGEDAAGYYDMDTYDNYEPSSYSYSYYSYDGDEWYYSYTYYYEYADSANE